MLRKNILAEIVFHFLPDRVDVVRSVLLVIELDDGVAAMNTVVRLLALLGGDRPVVAAAVLLALAPTTLALPRCGPSCGEGLASAHLCKLWRRRASKSDGHWWRSDVA